MYTSESEKLNRFIILRNQYIDFLEQGKINKSEFNNLNNEIFKKINLRPFSVLDSFNKALYNYNYYNSKAKLCLEECNRYKQVKDNRSVRKAKIAENNKSNNYYHKDEAIIAMIELEDKDYIEAYFIKLNSKALADSIFEIHFKNRQRIILHTKNDKIRHLLIEKNIFINESRQSLISNYVNA